jgi:hypothetical protein
VLVCGERKKGNFGSVCVFRIMKQRRWVHIYVFLCWHRSRSERRRRSKASGTLPPLVDDSNHGVRIFIFQFSGGVGGGETSTRTRKSWRGTSVGWQFRLISLPHIHNNVCFA